jgi:hypothetical protein
VYRKWLELAGATPPGVELPHAEAYLELAGDTPPGSTFYWRMHGRGSPPHLELTSRGTLAPDSGI